MYVRYHLNGRQLKKLIRYIKKHWFLWLLLVIAGFMVWSIRFEIADWVRAKVGGGVTRKSTSTGHQ